MARMILPQDDGLKAVVAALGGEVRLVGGVVRDTLAGQVTKDIDLATPLLPEKVIEKLSAAGIKCVPTGLAHGTVTAVVEGRPFEITTLRRDVSTDGRRATVTFTDDWQEDAARRDFTVNALYADPDTGEIQDYFGGVADLEAGIVRFIGEPLTRIAEDHLRILRFFRFNARFGKGTPHAESLAACRVRANDLMALSRERIAMELLAILTLPNPESAIGLMIDNGIFVPVLPEIADAASLGRLLEREKALASEPDALRRLAALLPADPALAEDVGNRLRLSNAQRKQLITLASRSVDDNTNPKALAYRLGVEAAMDRLLLGTGDAAAILGWTPPKFPLTGGSILARGIQAGPEVARVLQAAERQWIEEGFPDAKRVEEIADSLT
jgi:poly(A) polymerase